MTKPAFPRFSSWRLAAPLLMLAAAGAGAAAAEATPQAEVRGTWLTTTANSALRTPADTEATMARLRAIGMNTVYVESWKNGYAQFPSDVLERTVGVRQRPALMAQDPSDSPAARQAPPRDLLQEALISAHRNGLVYIAWFEYGFMAAYKDTINDLRRKKPEWLSRDKDGGEVAPNGFVWLNPLHPEAQRFLLDLVLEAVEKYDLDGVQLDDHVVWPYVTMGYDEYTQQAYAADHGGQRPPADHLDKEWVRWRAEKVNEFGKRFVQELRARRPGLLVSLSPATHPWARDHYMLDWPAWARWSKGWDEFVPQVYRVGYEAYEKTWHEQVAAMRDEGGGRLRDMLAGIRIVGEGPDSSWDQLRRSIELARSTGSGGHVLWYSRGVLDLYEAQLTDFYKQSGPAVSPRFGAGWRQHSVALRHAGKPVGGLQRWPVPRLPAGAYRAIGHDGVTWRYLDAPVVAGRILSAPVVYKRVEVLLDRRKELLQTQQLSK
ncbi:glycoside hydrolase family 10 protein [Pseudoduganella aquatica]|uniref:Family 10 glycosylhydrolase n=1 Tax=Pseudoduganella aquatica TaxID=2660641 RepID=A0A7X4H8S3_9BURK|nr:family 10 glycosylhydrolase [Pseudoduganella aquatica]MYN06753.1 family 10 glycosylhydrolase [Pseudoduganella aquatica]